MKQINIATGAFQILILIGLVWRVNQALVIPGHHVSPIPDTESETTVENESTPSSETNAPTVTNTVTTDPPVTKHPTTATTTTTTTESVGKDLDLKFVKYPVDIDTMVGMPITLRCQVKGKHQPTISWNKDNKSLDTDHVILRRESIRIRSALSSDQGTYMCVARDSNGLVATRDAKVTVTTELPSCGQRMTSKAKRIIGGNNATNYWPWQVLIEYPGDAICGGSLIGRYWVLTAAHCTHTRMYWYAKDDLLVRAGVYNRSSFDIHKQQVLKIARIIPHPRYQWGKPNFDIALLQLKHPVRITDTIGTICLPKSPVTDGTKCVTTGWGHTKLGDSHLPEQLQEVTVPIVSRSHCNRPEAYNKLLPKHTLCAGYDEGGKDSCQNDSGGPLSCYENKKWVLHGVTNSGYKCALPNKYGIYAQVSKYVPWITKEMSNKS